jgi:hypothetical protein
MEFLKVMFKRITPTQAIANELAEAEMELLKAETGVEYAAALVTYNKNRVKRLKAYMAEINKGEEHVSNR